MLENIIHFAWKELSSLLESWALIENGTKASETLCKLLDK